MPVTLDATVDTVGGVALVSVRVRNSEPVARRVRIGNRLDGAVLPPRRHGRPEAGWSAEGYVGVVDADDELALGYASEPGSSVSDVEWPVELVDVSDPADAETAPMDRVLAELPDARPPGDVIGPPDSTADHPAGTAPAGKRGSPADEADGPGDDIAGGTDESDDGQPVGADGGALSLDAASADAAATPPPAVRRYLAAVEARIERAETFESGSLADATELLEDGVDPAGTAAIVAVDAASLARLAERAGALAARAEECKVPAAAMERLA